MSGKKGMKTRKPLENFLPHHGRCKKTLILDLSCVILITLGELILSLMPRYTTSQGMQDPAPITAGIVIKIGGLYLLLQVIDSLATYYMAYIGRMIGVHIGTDIRQDAFEHLQMLSDNYCSNTKAEQIVLRITSDLFDMTKFAHHCPEELFIATLKTVVPFIVLLDINLELTLPILVLVPVMIISCAWFNMGVKEAFRRQRNQIGELSAQIEDTLLSNRVVRASANEPVEIAKFGKGNQDFMDIKKYTYRYMVAFQITTRPLDGLIYVVVIVAGGIFMVRGRVESRDLTVHIMHVTTLLTTICRIIEFAGQFQCGITGIKRFQEIMDVVPDTRDSKSVKKMEHVKGAIIFDHASFEYPDDHVPVLGDINITVRPGERIALVGPSGGDKTIMCNLLPRFYDTTSGNIATDRQDIKNVTPQSLRSNIGVVQQDICLFSGSVYESINYGHLRATREEVMEAAKPTDVYEFITELQGGYDTYVGERGVKLSGGWKQRIGITRAFLKNPTIPTLGEATSAFDNESEYLVSQSLERPAASRTTLTTAYRLTTTQGTDRVLVLADNKVVEEGNYKQLLEKKGVYYQLYTTTNRLNRGIAQGRTLNMKIAIIAGSSNGVTQDEVKELDIYVLPVPFMIDGQVFYEGIDLSYEDSYTKMEEGVEITTSQPSPKDVTEQREQLLEDHDQVVYILIFSELSGSCQAALMLTEDYERHVQVVSNQRVSITQRQFALDVRDSAEWGWSDEQIKEKLKATRLDSSIYITVDTLRYLKKRGRIILAAAALETLLEIRPVFTIRGEKLDAFAETRTMKQVETIMLTALAHDLEDRPADPKAEHTYLQIAHTCSEQTAQELEGTVRELYPGVPVSRAPLPPSVGYYIGPDILVIACTRKLKKLE